MKQVTQQQSTFDGFLLVTGSPRRSLFFILATILAGACLAIDLYFVMGHWVSRQHDGMFYCPILGIFLIVNLWIRAIRYQVRIGQSATGDAYPIEPPAKTLLALANGGLVEILFWSFLLIFILLFYIVFVHIR